MEALQLDYFCHAARTQNFSHTAAAFTVPPSAVSQSIRRLEQELGVPLFDRKANRVILNEDGALFYRAVSDSKTLLESARRAITDRQGELTGTVRLCVICNRQAVFDTVARFTAKHPKVSFIVNHGPIKEGTFDLLISDRAPTGAAFSGEPLINEPIALAMSRHHPLAPAETVTLSMLKDERFITTQEYSSLCQLTVEHCKSAGFMPNFAIRCDDPYYLRRYLELGLGIAFVPTFSWQGQFSDEMVLKPLPDIFRQTLVFHDRSHPLSRTAEAFAKELQNFEKVVY